MSTPTTQVVRPAGAAMKPHVLLLCLLILAVAGSVVAWRGVSREPSRSPAISSTHAATSRLSRASMPICE